jgi:hypothetical protein
MDGGRVEIPITVSVLAAERGGAENWGTAGWFIAVLITGIDMA